MTPAKQAKAAGLKGLHEVSMISNRPRSTLYEWHKYNPQLFRVVIAGCVAVKNER